jgi:hypothetical protein
MLCTFKSQVQDSPNLVQDKHPNLVQGNPNLVQDAKKKR